MAATAAPIAARRLVLLFYMDHTSPHRLHIVHCQLGGYHRLDGRIQVQVLDRKEMMLTVGDHNPGGAEDRIELLP